MTSFDTRQYCIDNKLASFSLNLTWDSTNQKKVCEPISWSKIDKDNFVRFHDCKKFGFAILTGSINNIVVIDCDINKSKGQFPQDILDTLDSCCKSIVKTPNGKHYYFRTNKKLQKRTGAYWKGVKVEWLDVLAEKAMIYAPPSHYLRGDESVGYRWILGDLSTLVDLPASVEEALIEPERVTLAISSTTEENIESILDGLTIERWSNYEDWLKIGIVLFNSGYSVVLWDKYSKKATNYNSRACFDKWESFGKSKSKECLGIGTLYWFLKEDNPSLFDSLRGSIENIYIRCASATHQNTATIYYLANPTKYIYSPQLGWYTLGENNIWKHSEDLPEKMMTNISDTVANLCDSARDYFNNKAREEDDEDRKKNYQVMVANCIKHKRSIQSTGYAKGTIEWVKELYTDSKFFKNINAKRNLFAFQDAVFDFSTLSFRKIEITDYISVTCPYPAPSLDSPIDERLLKFLHSIFECEEDLEYLLKILASSLDGFNRFQECYMFLGSGGNGKGMIYNHHTRCIGQYAYSLPISYFTQKTEAKGSALPELAECAFSRFVACSEPESTERLQVGFLKKITGNETQSVRKLYGKPFEYLPQFTVFIFCNGVKLSRADMGIKRRLQVITFPFQFKSEQDYNPENPEHRLADPNLETVLQDPVLCQSYLALLLKTYTKHNLYKANEITRPQSILKSTAEYFDDNNPIANWLFENYDTKADNKKKITPTELLNQYKSDTGKDCNSNQFSIYLSLLGFSIKKDNGKKVYRGIERKERIVD